jgi:hypothetical protein
MKTTNIVLICFISFLLCFTTYLKVLGSSNIPIDVEKNGYCKFIYGDNSNNIKGTNICSNGINKVTFSDNEFRNLCPKNKLISTDFYSNCFYKSGGIN